MKAIRVLLAEDHAVVREGFRDLIAREEDMEVVAEASDGEAAVRLSSQTRPDVILMDIRMPGIDGIEATRRIKNECPDACVLVLTAYDDEELILAAIEAQAAGYLLKTVRGHELLNAIRSVHAGDSVLHPKVAGKVVAQLRAGSVSPRRRSVSVLSVREMQVVRLGAQGRSNKEIAAELGLSDRTIQTHWRNIFVKLDVGSRMEAVMTCLRDGLIDLDT